MVHAAVLVGVSLAHGQVSTTFFQFILFLMFCLCVKCIMYNVSIFNVAGHWAQKNIPES